MRDTVPKVMAWPRISRTGGNTEAFLTQSSQRREQNALLTTTGQVYQPLIPALERQWQAEP